jgi:hypothetical protein
MLDGVAVVMERETLEKDLKPCPFCGGDELSHGWSSPGIDGSSSTGSVECHACNALVYAETEVQAIAVWNGHAQCTPFPERQKWAALAMEIACVAVLDYGEDIDGKAIQTLARRRTLHKDHPAYVAAYSALCFSARSSSPYIDLPAAITPTVEVDGEESK